MKKMERKNYVNISPIANNDAFFICTAMNDQTEKRMFRLAVKVIDLQSHTHTHTHWIKIGTLEE